MNAQLLERSEALTAARDVHTPALYVRYGAMKEATRIFEASAEFKRNKDTNAKLAANLALARRSYLEAFQAEVQQISHDRLITRAPVAAFREASSSIRIEIHLRLEHVAAVYWPNGPTDIPALSRMDRLEVAFELGSGDYIEVESSEHIFAILLERHLRIRSSELEFLAEKRSAREAWRELKHLMDGYPEPGSCEPGATACAIHRHGVLCAAADVLRQAAQRHSGNEGSYKDNIMRIAQSLREQADRAAEDLERKLLAEFRATARAVLIVCWRQLSRDEAKGIISGDASKEASKESTPGAAFA